MAVDAHRTAKVGGADEAAPTDMKRGIFQLQPDAGGLIPGDPAASMYGE